MAEKVCPCDKCTRGRCTNYGDLPGCEPWRKWWIEKWERTRKLLQKHLKK